MTDNWSHRNSNKRLIEKSGSHTGLTFNRITTQDSYTWCSTRNMTSTAVWNMKPERWGSPPVQERKDLWQDKISKVNVTSRHAIKPERDIPSRMSLQPLPDPGLPQKALPLSLHPVRLAHPHVPTICNESLCDGVLFLVLGFPTDLELQNLPSKIFFWILSSSILKTWHAHPSFKFQYLQRYSGLCEDYKFHWQVRFISFWNWSFHLFLGRAINLCLRTPDIPIPYYLSKPACVLITRSLQ